MDAYGRQTSAEILTTLAVLRATRIKILEREKVSDSANGRQTVYGSKANLPLLADEESRLMGMLDDAYCREGTYPGSPSIYRVFPIG